MNQSQTGSLQITNMHQLVLLLLLLTLQCALFQEEEKFPVPIMNLELEQNKKSMSRRLFNTSAPLYEGIGTHYSFIWVGSPPQRVSVIMDTGSHHTAFPCVGCNCGRRMDPFFDPAKSKSSSTKKCGLNGGKCFFRQSYSEGSSWHAFKVVDKVYIGGPLENEIVEASNLTLFFEFGCQESETGLFRTQNVGGIMGLSAADETLPFQLYKHKLTSTRMFGLCFKIGGGIMTLGGVDPSLNFYTRPGEKDKQRIASKVEFARLTKKRGWYTVSVIDILMHNPVENKAVTIGGSIFKCNAGRGTIVDSGTTDTYLPAALHNNFAKMFRSITGLKYKNEAISIPKQVYAKLPSIIYRLESVTAGQSIDITVHPNSYMERQGVDRYVPRVYLTEAVGAVLGANFMDRNNVIFDIDGMRVGFAQSDCNFINNKKKQS